VFTFDVKYSDLAILTFEAFHEDLTQTTTVLGFSSLPLLSVRNGIRSIPLRDLNGIEIEHSAILVHIELIFPGAKDTVKQKRNIQFEKLR
jgi:hypothetical protein